MATEEEWRQRGAKTGRWIGLIGRFVGTTGGLWFFIEKTVHWIGG